LVCQYIAKVPVCFACCGSAGNPGGRLRILDEIAGRLTFSFMSLRQGSRELLLEFPDAGHQLFAFHQQLLLLTIQQFECSPVVRLISVPSLPVGRLGRAHLCGHAVSVLIRRVVRDRAVRRSHAVSSGHRREFQQLLRPIQPALQHIHFEPPLGEQKGGRRTAAPRVATDHPHRPGNRTARRCVYPIGGPVLAFGAELPAGIRREACVTRPELINRRNTYREQLNCPSYSHKIASPESGSMYSSKALHRRALADFNTFQPYLAWRLLHGGSACQTSLFTAPGRNPTSVSELESVVAPSRIAMVRRPRPFDFFGRHLRSQHHHRIRCAESNRNSLGTCRKCSRKARATTESCLPEG
jgi:hypothetical protein